MEPEQFRKSVTSSQKENENKANNLNAFEIFQAEIKKRRISNQAMNKLDQTKASSRSFVLNQFSNIELFDFKFNQPIIKQQSSSYSNIEIWKTLEKFNQDPLSFSNFLSTNNKKPVIQQHNQEVIFEIKEEERCSMMEIQSQQLNQQNYQLKNEKKILHRKNQSKNGNQDKINNLKGRKKQIIQMNQQDLDPKVKNISPNFGKTSLQNYWKFISLSEYQIMEKTGNRRYPNRVRIQALRYWCEKKVYKNGEWVGILTKYY